MGGSLVKDVFYHFFKPPLLCILISSGHCVCYKFGFVLSYAASEFFPNDVHVLDNSVEIVSLGFGYPPPLVVLIVLCEAVLPFPTIGVLPLGSCPLFC